MNRTQGHFFNRTWVDHDKDEREEEYIPACKRQGFDESKIIKLPPGAATGESENDSST